MLPGLQIQGALGEGDAQLCPSLSLAASRRHWFWGTSVDRQILDDPAVVRLVKTHARVLVPENAMKWEVVNPRPRRPRPIGFRLPRSSVRAQRHALSRTPTGLA